MAKKKVDLLLVVRGDYNDADFVTKATPINQENLDRFMSLIKAISKFKPYEGISERGDATPAESRAWSHDHNWPCGEYGCRKDLGEKTITELYRSDKISEDLIQEFDEEYVPHGEDWNLHTIHEIYTVRLADKLYTNKSGWATV